MTVSDCTTAATPELHDGAIRSIAWNFGMVTTSEEIIGIWQASPTPTEVRVGVVGAPSNS